MEMIKQIVAAIALSFVSAAFAQTYIVPDGDCGAITLHATRGTDVPGAGLVHGYGDEPPSRSAAARALAR